MWQMNPKVLAAESGTVTSVEGEVVQVELRDGQEVTAIYSLPQGLSLPDVRPRDRVIIETNQSLEESAPPYIVTDFDRSAPLLWLTILFVAVTLVITRMWGLKSFIGMLFTFYLIFKLLLPQIMAGQDPVVMSVMTALFIIPVTFYLSHGVNRKTNSAIIGTVLTLIMTGILAAIFVNLAHLTGLASEEAGFLLAFMGETISTRGLLLAGIIIGSLGVLDDVTISQAAIVTELREANPSLKSRELFTRAMRVGHDHISSMINTLVLVYTGASLPLLLLFLDSSQSLGTVINHEIIAEEVVRTLVGSLGLILAVPLTTLIAVIPGRRR